MVTIRCKHLFLLALLIASQCATSFAQVCQQIDLTTRAVNVNHHAGALAVADLDRDGFADLVSTDNQSSGNLLVWRGLGNRTLSPTSISSPAGMFPEALAIADFNGDAALDVVVVNGEANTLSILPGVGNGHFDLPLELSTELLSAPQSETPFLQAVDINFDGDDDILFAKQGMIFVFENESTAGSFSFTLSFHESVSQMGVLALGDVNGDVFPDLVVASGSDALIYTNSWFSTFFLQDTLPMRGEPAHLSLSDFDSNLFPNLIADFGGSPALGVDIWLNQFGSLDQVAPLTFSGVAGIQSVADLNQDDVPDIFAAFGSVIHSEGEDRFLGELRVLLNAADDGELDFIVDQTIALGEVTHLSGITGDLDGNGRADLILSTSQSSLTVFWNDGKADCGVLAGDMNRDGVINYDDADEFILALQDPEGYEQIFGPGSLENGDIDLDGVVDEFDFEFFALLLSPQPFPADANLDRCVDGTDFDILHSNLFMFYWGRFFGDFNRDGAVDVSDFNIWNEDRFNCLPLPAAAPVSQPRALISGHASSASATPSLSPSPSLTPVA